MKFTPNFKTMEDSGLYEASGLHILEEISDRHHIYTEIDNERKKQDEKFGPILTRKGYTPFVWSAILQEETGEAAQAILKKHFEGGKAEDIRKELIQVAAVAVAMIEIYDEKGL